MCMANRIKERRLAMGFTQEELAEKLGLQKSAIAKYENGRVENIKRSIISKMSDILECSPSYLMGWSEADHIVKLDDNEELLIESYRSIPVESKRRLMKYASTLTQLCSLEAPMLNAAHERTDIEQSTEEKLLDYDMMSDENF